ncbi:MAG TPA: NEW3 domain-containing protein [Chloroflexota bacterium]|nr:NEW3 domain-containing protein [Chloroflexota bacterium]
MAPAAVLLLGLPAAALAQSASPSASPSPYTPPAPSATATPVPLPPGIFLTTTDLSIGTAAGKAITFPVDVLNNTSNVERIHLDDSAPKNWEPVLKDGSNDVTELQLLPGKDQSITFQVTPPADAPHTQQSLSVKGTTDDGLSSNLDLSVDITGQTTSGLAVTTDYPNLRGAAATKFEFSLSVANNTGKDNTFGLSASAPSNDWQVYFQQTASQTQISSLAVKSGSTQSVNLEVTSPDSAKPGDFPINVDVTDDAGDDAKVALKVTIVGNYKMALNTPGQQFAGGATAGQPATITLLVQNTGNAPLQNVGLSAGDVPNGWNVKFQPATLNNIDPGSTSQVQASVTPAGNTAAGDYVINFQASAPQASVDKDYRLTVQTANPILGWAGVGVAIVLVGAAVWLFRSQSLNAR